MGGTHLNQPIVGMAADPATGGYWQVASDGGIFSFNAPFEGSMGGMHLNQPIVGMAVDPATGGYWEVASDGGIFSFNAPFEGSMGGIHLNQPIVGMAADPATGGYWEVASDGGIFSFNAPFEGSMGGTHLNQPIVGMAADPATGGYWVVASDGGIFSFNAPFQGSMGGTHLNQPIVGMAADPATGGYWEVASDGGIFSFNAPFQGSMGGTHLNQPIVGIAPDLVTPSAALTQDAPTSATVAHGAGYAGQLATNSTGAVTYVETTSDNSTDVAVSSSGAISATTALVPGTYAVTGTDSNVHGGNGEWAFSLTVNAVGTVTLTLGPPTSATVAHGAGYTGHLAVTNGTGAVAYAEASANSADVVVSSTGAISATTTLSPGTYAVSGTDSDVHGDTGTWAFSLTVGTVTLTQGPPTAATAADGAGYTGKLAVTNNSGAVTYVETTSTDSTDVVVSSTGAISAATTLPFKSYTVGGTDSDASGDTGTWAFSLTVGTVTLTQGPPTSATVAHGAGYTGQLTTTNGSGAVTYVETASADSTDVVVSSTGAVSSATTLAPGSYAVTGTDSDIHSDTGAWSFSLTVGTVTLVQGAPSSALVAHGVGYAGQLTTTNNNGGVSYDEAPSADSTDVVVSSTGAVTAAATLPPGTYTVGGADSDVHGDTGAWAFSLTVGTVTLTQGPPTTATVAHGAGYTGHLAVTNNIGAVTYVETTSTDSADVAVSSTGAVTAATTLAPGAYGVTGTESDVHGDTGAWSFSLTVGTITLTQGPPTTATVAHGAGYTGQLAVTNNIGAVTYVEITSTDSTDVVVSSTGSVTASTTLAPGSYGVSGTDSDIHGDIGTWAFSLTVGTITLTQGPPTSATAAHGAGYTGQLALTNNIGAVSYVETTSTDSTDVVVSSTGAVTAATTLAPGTYGVSGTDSDIHGDSGTWAFSLTVGTITLTQGPPTSATVAHGAGYTGQLALTNNIGAVAYVETTSTDSTDVAVSSTGAVTAATTLAPGTYTVGGTDSDMPGDTGAWAFSLTVGTVTLIQGAPSSALVAHGIGYSGQLTTTNNNGAVTYVETPSTDSTDVAVSSTGAVTAATTLAPGTYTVGGTDSDVSGDTGTWAFSLTVGTVTIVQAAPTAGTTTTTGSASFTDQLATTGSDGNGVAFVTTTPSLAITVSPSGAVSTSGALAAGTYSLSGTDSDGSGDAGTWSYSLTVTAVTIAQAAPTAGTTTTTGSASFTDQLATTGSDGNGVAFVTTTPSLAITVSPSGAVSTSGAVAAGTYFVSGTDSDGSGDTGTWSYSLTVTAVTIAQAAPTASTTTTAGSAAFTDQLATTGSDGNGVAFVTTTPSLAVTVSPSGAVSTSGALAAGTYSLSGTDSDGSGDTGTWSYSLTVTAVTIAQAAPTAGTTTTTGSAAFTDQLATTGSDGNGVAFVTTATSSGYITVSPSGAVSTSGAVPAGTYSVSGTDSDGSGDTGTWSYSLTVTAVTIAQAAPTASTTTTTGSAAFTDQLATTGSDGNGVAFVTTTPSLAVTVSPSGAVSTSGAVAAGTYFVSGTDSDGSGDTGTWSYSLTVTAVTIAQAAPTAGTTTTTGSAAFTDQLATTGSDGNGVAFVTTATSSGYITVSPSGAVSTSGAVPAGTYTVSGTDSDGSGDTGTWSYSLTVTAVTIAQAAPTAGTTTTTGSAGFTDQLATIDSDGNGVAFVTTTPSLAITVSPSGAVSTSGALAAGGYTVSGTDSDGSGDTGTWGYSVTVTAVTLTQGPPTSATVAHGAGYTGQLAVTNNVGAVTYVETTSTDSTDVAVSSTGAVTAATTLAPGTYTVGGTDSDVSGDSGTWAFSLTVGTITLTQGPPTAATVAHGAGYTGQLALTNNIEAVTYVETTSTDSADVAVSSTGAVTAATTLAPGTYTVGGTDSDVSGDSGNLGLLPHRGHHHPDPGATHRGHRGPWRRVHRPTGPDQQHRSSDLRRDHLDRLHRCGGVLDRSRHCRHHPGPWDLHGGRHRLGRVR